MGKRWWGPSSGAGAEYDGWYTMGRAETVRERGREDMVVGAEA